MTVRRLENRVAIVTGAGGGIGREYALLLAREGARVVVNDIGRQVAGPGGQRVCAAAVVEEIRAAGGEAVASTDSAASWSGTAAIVETAIATYGRLDILINNATVIRVNDLWRFSEEDWDLVVDVNFKGYFAMLRHATPHMARQRRGVVINISSASGFGHPCNIAYAAAKEGLVGLTRTAAMELGRFGIRANAIRPGAASWAARVEYKRMTERFAALMDAAMNPPGDRHGGGTGNRIDDPIAQAPSKVAPLVVWLCTDAAHDVTGRTFHVMGDQVGLYSEPCVERLLERDRAWDLDELDHEAPSRLVQSLTNPYRLDDYPDLQKFEE